MKKLLLILSVSLLSIAAKAQTFSGEAIIGAPSRTGQVVCTDTIVLNQGRVSCQHLYVSANAEQEAKSVRHLMLVIRRCLTEDFDYIICNKCLRHLKIVQQIECITVRTYSELLKEIESNEKRH